MTKKKKYHRCKPGEIHDAFAVCKNCGSWHYTHNDERNIAAMNCPGFVDSGLTGDTRGKR